jgi:tetratricopeptide (TPR) repeat protein
MSPATRYEKFKKRYRRFFQAVTLIEKIQNTLKPFDSFEVYQAFQKKAEELFSQNLISLARDAYQHAFQALDKNDVNRQLQCMAKLTNLNPEDSESRLEYSSFLRDHGFQHEASVEYLKVAEIYRRDKRYHDALVAYYDVVNLRGSINLNLCILLAETHACLQDWELAESYFEKALRMSKIRSRRDLLWLYVLFCYLLRAESSDKIYEVIEDLSFVTTTEDTINLHLTLQSLTIAVYERNFQAYLDAVKEISDYEIKDFEKTMILAIGEKILSLR